MKFESYRISELIEEIAMGPFGSNIKVECFVDNGIPVLNGSNLDGITLKDGSFRYITEEKAESLKRANAHRGDIVITHRGTLGQIVYIPRNSKYDRYVISQSQFRIRCNEKVLPEYLVYYFHTPIGQAKLLSNASQVGVPALARPSTTFQQIEVELPNLSIQKKTIGILRSLDDKIELNNKINENLEKQAEAIYQKCFGDVDIAKKQGILSDICTYSKEKVAVSKLEANTYFSTVNMLPGKSGAAEASTLPTAPQTTACHIGDTLISNIRPYFKKIVYCYNECGCSSDVLCFTPIHSKYAAYLYSTLYTDRFFDFMVSGSRGTKMPRGDKHQIMTYPVVLPSDTELDEFNSVVTPFLSLIHNNRNESRQLSLMRNTLLPKLMNGEFEVNG